MHIQKISANGLKGRNFEEALGPLNIIYGPNFAGKTSRLVALRLALTGKDPSVGARNADVFKLSGGSAMRVSATLSDGRVFEREWSQDRKGAVKATGSKETLVNPTLDSTAYFSLTPAERIKYVFASADLEGMGLDRAGILADILKLATVQTEWFRDELRDEPTLTIQAQIDAWVEKLRELYKQSSDAHKRAAEACMKLTELKTADASASSERITSVRALIAGLRSKQAELSKVLGGHLKTNETAGRARANAANRVSELADRVRSISEDHANERLAGIRKEMEACLSTTKLEDAVAQRAAGEQELVRLAGEIKLQQQRISELANRQREAMKKIADLKDCRTCPTCGAKAEDGLVMVLDAMGALAATVKGEMETAGANLEKLNSEYAAGTRADAMTRNLVDDLTAKRDKLLKLDAEKVRIEAEEASREKRLAEARIDLDVARIELAKTPEADEAEAETTKREIDAVAEEIVTQDKVLSQMEATARDLVLFEKTKTDRDEAELAVECCKAMAKSLKEKKSEIAEAVLKPICDTANRIFGVTGQKLELVDGEVGYFRDSRFVSIEAFSGTEQLLAYAGFAAGLAAKAELRLVILDEFGRLSDDNKEAVMTSLAKAVEDRVIDQTILVDVSAPRLESADWNMIRLGAQK